MPVVTLSGSVDGDLEGGDSEKIIDYVDEYGINPNRLSIQAEGSDSQVYETNDWNRIVIFAPAK